MRIQATQSLDFPQSFHLVAICEALAEPLQRDCELGHQKAPNQRFRYLHSIDMSVYFMLCLQNFRKRAFAELGKHAKVVESVLLSHRARSPSRQCPGGSRAAALTDRIGNAYVSVHAGLKRPFVELLGDLRSLPQPHPAPSCAFVQTCPTVGQAALNCQSKVFCNPIIFCANLSGKGAELRTTRARDLSAPLPRPAFPNMEFFAPLNINTSNIISYTVH